MPAPPPPPLVLKGGKLKIDPGRKEREKFAAMEIIERCSEPVKKSYDVLEELWGKFKKALHGQSFVMYLHASHRYKKEVITFVLSVRNFAKRCEARAKFPSYYDTELQLVKGKVRNVKLQTIKICSGLDILSRVPNVGAGTMKLIKDGYQHCDDLNRVLKELHKEL